MIRQVFSILTEAMEYERPQVCDLLEITLVLFKNRALAILVAAFSVIPCEF